MVSYMAVEFVIKDFLWLIIKDNIIVNFIYRYILPCLFKHHGSYDVGNYELSSKDTIKNNSKYKSASKFFHIKGYTSGTTNTPMTVFRSLKSILLEEYIIKTYIYDCGAPFSPRVAILRGDLVKNATDNKAPFWKKTPFTNRLLMSSFHLSQDAIPLYLAELERFKPDIIMAYPSSITLIAKEAKRLGWSPNWELSGIFTSSETFNLAEQDLVRSVFGGDVYDHYGQAERVAVLQQCKLGNYHVRNDYSAVEFIEDECGIKIVGSNVHNKAMPLHRYDTGDYVEGYEPLKPCGCGNKNVFVRKIIGRDDDYIILPDGRKIGRLDVAFKDVEGISACQIEQCSLYRARIRFIHNPSISVDDLIMNLEKKLRERLGSSLELEFESVEYIQRTKAGKFKSVIRCRELGNA